MQITFTNGITVIFPTSAVDDGSVEIEELSTEQSQITIVGETSEVRPKPRGQRSAKYPPEEALEDVDTGD